MFRTLVKFPRKVINRRYVSSTNRSFKEVEIKVPWGVIRGKWWEPYNIRPILTMHGWQDNCGSFDRLIPLLSQEVGFLAIDFPGHGYSSRLPYGVEYTSNLYLITVLSIQSELKWPKISLMGHSLGSVMSYVYTTLYNDRVDFTICIDVMKAMYRTGVRERMARNLERFLKYNFYAESPEEPPAYTMDEIKSKISTVHNNSVIIEHCECLIERNIAPSKLYPGKYYFTRDPRLKISIPNMLSQQQQVEDAEQVKTPIFVAKCKGASYYEPKENFYEVLEVVKRASPDCDFHYVDGKHHAHVNTPEVMSDLINSFLSRHNTTNRSIGGIQDDIIVPYTSKSVFN